MVIVEGDIVTIVREKCAGYRPTNFKGSTRLDSALNDVFAYLSEPSADFVQVDLLRLG